MKRAIALSLLLGGCFGPLIQDPRTACSVAQVAATEARAGTIRPRDLVELSAGNPRARALAESAFHQQNTVTALSVMGAAALLSGLIMGFVADPAQPELRNVGYGLVGGAIGLGALSIGLGYSGRSTRQKALMALMRYAQTCSTDAP